MRSNKGLFLILVIVLVGITSLTLIAHAQEANIDLSLSSIPLNPTPLQQVTISAESYATDLNQAQTVWTYNGKTIASGTGITDVTVNAPASGQTGTVTITASGGDFLTTSASLTLRPDSVDLLWEGADSYTPPFYEGLAIPSAGSIIRVTAIPESTAPTNLSYTWTENGDAAQAQSGYNKSSLLFQDNVLLSQDEIAVTEQNGNFSGSNTVDINPGTPQLVGYINNNGYIDYANGSTSTLSTSDNGVIVHFEPYFFSTPVSLAHDLGFSYTDDEGNSLPAGSIINELSLTSPQGGGQSQFNVAVSTLVYSLQNITRQFSVNFN